jgi:hypothetical protein
VLVPPRSSSGSPRKAQQQQQQQQCACLPQCSHQEFSHPADLPHCFLIGRWGAWMPAGATW